MNPQVSLQRQVAAEKEYLLKMQNLANQNSALNTIESQAPREDPTKETKSPRHVDLPEENPYNFPQNQSLTKNMSNEDLRQSTNSDSSPVKKEKQRILNKIKYLKSKLKFPQDIKEEGLKFIG